MITIEAINELFGQLVDAIQDEGDDEAVKQEKIAVASVEIVQVAMINVYWIANALERLATAQEQLTSIQQQMYLAMPNKVGLPPAGADTQSTNAV